MNRLIEYRILEEEDYELYLYGFKQLLIIMLHLTTYTVIALMYQEIGYLVVFLGFFIPLRSYAGGYHATSQLTCYLVSVATVVGVLTALKYDLISLTTHIVFAIVSYAIIVMLAPRESSNKPYEGNDKVVYRKKSLWILNTEAFIVVFMLGIGHIKLFECMSLALFLSAFLLSLDWLKEKWQAEIK